MEILSVASFGYVCLGLFVGFLSGFLGIGGGAAAVPIIVFLGFDVKYAIGVSVLSNYFILYIITYLMVLCQKILI